MSQPLRGVRRLDRLRSHALPAWAPVAGVLVLLAVGGATLSWRHAVAFPERPLLGGGLIVGVLVALVVAGVLVTMLTARHRGSGVRVGRRRKDSVAGRVFAALALIAVVYYVMTHRPDQLRHPALPVPPVAPGTTGPPGAPDAVTGWLLAAIAAALGAVLVVLVLVVRRMAPPAVDAADEDADPAELADQVRAAVRAGRAVIFADADPRAGVVSCYVAMEGALASAGVVRGRSGTPGRLLERARSAGLLGGPADDAAAALTGLFRRARFSARSMAETDRTAAAQALATLAARLSAAAAGRPAGSPR